MARYMLIESGAAVNAIEVIDPSEFPQFDLVQSDTANIGDTWDGEEFFSPALPVIVPESITPRQGMLILSRYGLLASVQTMLDGMSGQEGVEARIDFERANEWKRSWPLLNAMATAAGLSQEQVDQMFIEGAKL